MCSEHTSYVPNVYIKANSYLSDIEYLFINSKDGLPWFNTFVSNCPCQQDKLTKSKKKKNEEAWIVLGN